MTFLTHSLYLTIRHLRALWRQPWYVAITLVQPIFWLLLFGALFKKIVEIPGFGASSYIDFLTPGIVIMSAFFSAGWVGMGIIEDLERGVMDRLLISPANRGAMIVGRLSYQSVVTLVQTAIIIGLGWLSGAHFQGGPAGALLLTVAAILLGIVFASLSMTVALLLRNQESLIGVAQFMTLPLSFLSAAFMQLTLAPAWIQKAALFNPVNWAVVAGRDAVSAEDWNAVLTNSIELAALAFVFAWLSTRAFRAYQHSV
ncbi:MAG TPA: ABC transporter permease [Chloroflexota bacterium]